MVHDLSSAFPTAALRGLLGRFACRKAFRALEENSRAAFVAATTVPRFASRAMNIILFFAAH
jgi:hypothetical protein